jgi:hypothetical protein
MVAEGAFEKWIDGLESRFASDSEGISDGLGLRYAWAVW